tara:strand:+ start:316 stop:516 length:201 start_codon:yes stop_codon:yes gene_type:complete
VDAPCDEILGCVYQWNGFGYELAADNCPDRCADCPDEPGTSPDGGLATFNTPCSDEGGGGGPGGLG